MLTNPITRKNPIVGSLVSVAGHGELKTFCVIIAAVIYCWNAGDAAKNDKQNISSMKKIKICTINHPQITHFKRKETLMHKL